MNGTVDVQPNLSDGGPAALTVALASDAAAAARAGRLPLALKAGYSAGQLVELVVVSMLNIFVLFYATAVCGLSAGLAGLALGAGLVVDAVMDPLIGSLSDSWRSRFGRRTPFMVIALVPIVVTFNLLFALPSTLGGLGLFFWLMLLSVALRISLSLFSLPYQALGAELSDDYAERSSIAAWRWGIGILGTVAVIVLGYGVFLAGARGMSHRSGYHSLALTLTVLLVAGALVSVLTSVSTRSRQHQAAAQTGAVHSRLPGEVAEVFGNPNFRVLFFSSLLFNIAAGLNQALALHVGTFFWRLSTGELQAVSLAVVVGLALGAPLSAPLAARMEKRTLLVIGLTGMVVIQTVPTSLRLLGLLPWTGSALTLLLSTTSFLLGLLLALATIAFLSIIPDAADEHEQLFGTRREGLYFAGWSFAVKAASGAGVLIAGVVLQLIHFPSHLAEQGAAAAALPTRTVALLGVAGGPGSGLLSIAGIVVALFYSLNQGAHARIMAELNRRRELATVAVAAGDEALATQAITS